MASAQPQTQILRAVFQSCRPQSSLKLRFSTEKLTPLYRSTQYQPVRHHSTNQPSPVTSSAPQSSVSQSEVSHFSRLASSWWDPHGPSRLLHLMNPLRHDFIQSCLQSTPDNIPQKYTYLDVGCGGGIFASSAARKPDTAWVTAIDPTPEVIAVARSHQRTDPALSPPKLTYLNCAIEDLPTDQAPQHDILTLFEVIEHIDEPSRFLRTALAQLKPGGWLIGSTISRHPISYLTTKLIAEAPLLGVVPAGTHDWNKYIKPEELKGWFEKEKLQDGSDEGTHVFGSVRVEGVVYVPMWGWRFVKGSENVGNYFFGVQKLA